MKKNAFKYLIVSVLSLIGLNQNASAYGDKIYHDEAGIAMSRAHDILDKYCQYKNKTKLECTELGFWTNTKNGGIVGNFYTISDQQTINEIMKIYIQYFYENAQKFDVIVNFYQRSHKDAIEGKLFFQDKPFMKLELKRIEK